MLGVRIGRILRLLALSGIVVAALPARASAEWQFTPMFGWSFKGDSTIADPEGERNKVHWTLGGTTTVIGDGPIGVEGLFLYTPGFFGKNTLLVTGSSSIALMGNVVLATPRAWNEYGLRPFVSGGVGLLRASLDDPSDVLDVHHNIAGLNIGGGAIGFITDRTGLRFDLRYLRHLKPASPEGTSFGDVRLSYWTAMVGVVIRY